MYYCNPCLIGLHCVNLPWMQSQYVQYTRRLQHVQYWQLRCILYSTKNKMNCWQHFHHNTACMWLAVHLCVSTHYSRMQCRHHNSFAYHPSLQGCTHHDLHDARPQEPTLLNYHFHGWIRFTWLPRPQYRHTDMECVLVPRKMRQQCASKGSVVK